MTAKIEIMPWDNFYYRTDNTISAYSYPNINPDWHSESTILLGELVQGGFNPFGDSDWDNAQWYSQDQKTRIEKKFLKRYKWFEIGIVPPLQWRDMITSKCIEICPKYNALYAMLESGTNPLNSEDEYYKHRNVFSDFPATQLNPQLQDYASNANDDEYERIVQRDVIDNIEKYKDYNDVDAMFLNEFQTFFNQIGDTTQW